MTVPTTASPDPSAAVSSTTGVGDPTGSPLAGFEVQPAVLRRAGAAFQTDAELLVEAATRLDSHLSRLGACWGDDPVGARFGATYRPASDTVRANLGSLTVGLLRIASALRAVADSYELVDQDAAGIARSSGTASPRRREDP